MDVSNRKAPKREVVGIFKQGSWGKYEYAHQLDCGHTEMRKRAASTPKIACRLCVWAASKGEELKALVAVPQRTVMVDVDDVISVDEDHVAEVEAGRLRAGLASNWGIPQEAIDVVVSDVDGRLVVSSVVVFLSGNDAKRLGRKT